MKGNAGPALLTPYMNTLLTLGAFAALHTGTVLPDEPTATEIVGGQYARQPITWDQNLGGTATANNAPLVWSGLPTALIVGVAVYTTATGGSWTLWVPLPTPRAVAWGAGFIVSTHDLYVEII